MGKNEIAAEIVQIKPIEMGTELRVIHSVYCKGSLMCMYLKLIKKKYSLKLGDNEQLGIGTFCSL
jgi:hypothetical protein